MTKNEALRLAMDALVDADYQKGDEAIFAIKDVLAEPEWSELTRREITSWELPDAPTFVELVWFVERKIREKNE